MTPRQTPIAHAAEICITQTYASILQILAGIGEQREQQQHHHQHHQADAHGRQHHDRTA